MEPYWVITQRLLQHGSDPMVRRPKLTDQLLKRPPFRFIHDIISEITRRTGFADGLYAADELVASELKDKDSKMRYLSKIINVVGLTLDANVPVRPAKILAGLEPEQTNVFLQMLGHAAIGDRSKSMNAVYRCLGGELMQTPPNISAVEPSAFVPHESVSTNLSAEKLRRSMFSPSPPPDSSELSNKSAYQQDINKDVKSLLEEANAQVTEITQVVKPGEDPGTAEPSGTTGLKHSNITRNNDKLRSLCLKHLLKRRPRRMRSKTSCKGYEKISRLSATRLLLWENI